MLKSLLLFLLCYTSTVWPQNESLEPRAGSIDPMTSSNAGAYRLSGYCAAGRGDVNISFGNLTLQAPCQQTLGTYNLITDVSSETTTNPIKQCITQPGFPTPDCSNTANNLLAPPQIEFNLVNTKLPIIELNNVEIYTISGTCAPSSGSISINIGGNTFSTTCLNDHTFNTTENLSSLPDGTNINASATLSFTGQNAVDIALVDKNLTLETIITNTVITSKDGDSDGWYEEGDSVEITVEYLRTVFVNTNLGTPSISITFASGSKTAVYTSGSGTNSLVFTFDVSSGDEDCDGLVSLGALSLNGGRIRDGNNNDTNNGGLATSVISLMIDTTAPLFTGILDTSLDDALFDESTTANWALPTDTCGVQTQNLSLGLHNESNCVQPEGLVSYQSIGTVNSFKAVSGITPFDGTRSFFLDYNTQYCTSVESFDAAGNRSELNSAAWSRFDLIDDTTGVHLWLDASDETTLFQEDSCLTPSLDSDLIGCWQDKSGNSFDFTNTAGVDPGTRPTYSGNKVFFNNGAVTSDYLGRRLFDLPVNQNTTLLVAQSNDSGCGLVSYASPSHNNDFLLFRPESLQIYFQSPRTLGNSFSNESVFVANMQNSTDSINAFQNGVPNSGNTYNQTRFYSTGGTIMLAQEQDSVGDRLDPNQACTMNFSEYIIYDRVLNTIEQEELEGYLACKWGLRDQLDPTHLYFSTIAAEQSGCP